MPYRSKKLTFAISSPDEFLYALDEVVVNLQSFESLDNVRLCHGSLASLYQLTYCDTGIDRASEDIQRRRRRKRNQLKSWQIHSYMDCIDIEITHCTSLQTSWTSSREPATADDSHHDNGYYDNATWPVPAVQPMRHVTSNLAVTQTGACICHVSHSVFTARRCASAVYAVVVCPSVCPSQARMPKRRITQTTPYDAHL